MRELETERLILRQWRDGDAEILAEYASDPRIGPACGWKPFGSVGTARDTIRTILQKPVTFAVTSKALGGKVIGCCAVCASDVERIKDEPEIGYWLGAAYWGRGSMPEAVEELLRYTFEETDAESCRCAHFEGNEQSKRVIEKTGFRYVFSDDSDRRGPNKTMTLYYRVTKEEYLCRIA